MKAERAVARDGQQPRENGDDHNKYKLPYNSISQNDSSCYGTDMGNGEFEWDAEKDRENREKHGVSFGLAQQAFADALRVIAQDVTHSQQEARFFCLGRVGEGIIRIFGAGYWRKGKRIYEQENHIH